MTEPLDFSRDKLRKRPAAHRWWARRGPGASMAVVMLTNAPELAASAKLLTAIADDPGAYTGRELEGLDLLDLCAGACTVAGAAGQLGASVVAVDNHPLPVLIGRAELEYPSRFGATDQSARGSGPLRSWQGLSDEVVLWAKSLSDRAEVAAGELWLPGLTGVICAVRIMCPQCGYETAASSRQEDHPAPNASERGRSSCPACSANYMIRTAVRAGFEPTSVVIDRNNMVLPGFEIRALLEETGYTSTIEPLLDEPWVFGAAGPILIRDAITPRQSHVLRAFQESFRSIRDDMTDRGYSPGHSKAILTYMALGVNSLVDFLSTSARWDARRRTARGLERHEWSRGLEYFEVGGDLLKTILSRRFSEIAKVVESGYAQDAIRVCSGDMTALLDSDDSFDLVIWDPPFYDNIAYDRVSLPWTRFLRSLIGDLDADLKWPQDPTISDPPPRFDRDDYEQSLQAAVNEISRVLRPKGRLGVFWIARTGREVADLSEFLEMIEPVGLELVQTFAFSTESSSRPDDEGRQPLLLVFRNTSVAQPSDAAAVLEGTQRGRKMMVAGLVALLEVYVDDEELDDLIPLNYRGTRTERLAEVVLTEADPQHHLRVPR